MKDKLLKEGYISFSLKETFGDLYEILEKEYNENDFVWNTLVCSTNPDKLLELNLEDIELKGDYIIGDCDSAYKKIIDVNLRNRQMFFYGRTIDNKDSIFRSIIESIISRVYEIDYSTTDNPLYTKFKKECWIAEHQDGIQEGRICALLIYLNKDYENGFGGELVVDKNIITPEFGNVAILDYTKNDIDHAVTKVLKDNFERKAILLFAKHKENN